MVRLFLDFGFEKSIFGFKGHNLMEKGLSLPFMLSSNLCHFIKIGLDDFLKVSVKMLVRDVGGSLGFCRLSILRGFE
jgi:hypothetical protein